MEVSPIFMPLLPWFVRLHLRTHSCQGSTPVSHITALEQGQREVLICVCCSITSAPFLKGFPWPEEYPLGSDEEGSFSIIRLRSAQSIQHAEIADNQILSEGSTTRTIASFVGAQGLAYV